MKQKASPQRKLICVAALMAPLWLAFSGAQAQTAVCALGTAALLVGPSAGTNSVVLAVTPPSGAWTATSNAAWLRLSAPDQSGAGSANVVFSYDANPSATCSGSIIISGQRLTVTQAGSSYVAVKTVTTLVSGLLDPSGVAVDGSGNVYIADTLNSAVKKWTAGNNTATTLVSSGLLEPFGVAVDGAGNVYIADTLNNAVKKWTVANNRLTALVSVDLNRPQGVAVDAAGNVYIADTGDNVIKEWFAGTSNAITLVSEGLSGPCGVAVDAAGNVYIADTGHNAIKEWARNRGTVVSLVNAGLLDPFGVAVDGSGSVYIADASNNAIKKWMAADSNVTALVSSGLSSPRSVAVDGGGDVFIADHADGVVKELPYAFVDPTEKRESAAAGGDTLPAVLPVTANLRSPFAPATDQPWLSISGFTNGTVSVSFAANAGPSRAARVRLLGEIVPVTQEIIGAPAIATGAQIPVNNLIESAFSNNPAPSFPAPPVSPKN